MPDEGAGVLFIPDTIAIDSVSDFQEELIKAMTKPIEPGGASSMLPFVVRAPAHAMGSVRHLSMDDPWQALIDGG